MRLVGYLGLRAPATLCSSLSPPSRAAGDVGCLWAGEGELGVGSRGRPFTEQPLSAPGRSRSESAAQAQPQASASLQEEREVLRPGRRKAGDAGRGRTAAGGGGGAGGLNAVSAPPPPGSPLWLRPAALGLLPRQRLLLPPAGQGRRCCFSHGTRRAATEVGRRQVTVRGERVSPSGGASRSRGASGSAGVCRGWGRRV